MKSLVFHISLAAAAFSLSSCSSISESTNQSATYLQGFAPAERNQQKGYWDGDGVTGTPKIVINREEQKVFFYKGDQLVSVAPCSTGDEKHTTPPGTFKVTQKSKDHRSSLYGVHRDIATGVVINNDVNTRKDKTPPGAVYEGAPMWNFLRFNGGIGMHTGHLPGYPASHGCIRLPDHIAKKFFEHSPLGTKVIVQ